MSANIYGTINTQESNMPKSTFIPPSDHDFLIWLEHFIANLTPDLISAADLAAA